MKTIDTVISKLNNGDIFYRGTFEYLFVGKTVFQGIESYVGCSQANGKFIGFPYNEPVTIPRPKPVRTDFWYKKKFMELICHTIDHREVCDRFQNLCSRLLTTISKGFGIIEKLGGGVYCRDDYIITVDYKCCDGITIMLINTVTGKSVACRHINHKKVTTDNIQLILFDLYKKYMNQ